jgi:hypothetical protein
MDPDATIDRIIDALEDGDDTEAAWALEDLADWLQRGGFWPKKKNIERLCRAMAETLGED